MWLIGTASKGIVQPQGLGVTMLACSRLASSNVTDDRASVTMKQHEAPSAPRNSCFSCRMVTPPVFGALVLARGSVPKASLHHVHDRHQQNTTAV